MKTLKTIAELQTAIAEVRTPDKTVGLVPTMGALHNGHLSLVDVAKRQCDIVVVSIFVNPTQFNNPDDLSNYPRNLDADLQLLEKNGHCDIVFAPSVEEVYPEPDNRQFNFGSLAEVMEGKYRPGHFNGVAQVVSKLFDYVKPDKAFFGEKDFQQLVIIRKMTADLGLNIKIVGCPIVREKSGLAVSSRNVLLDEKGQKVAPKIYDALQDYSGKMGFYTPEALKKIVLDRLGCVKGLEVEYFSLCDGNTLQEISDWGDSDYVVGCITVYAGDNRIRLIDNFVYKDNRDD